jgi:hypothetical protein
METLLTNANGHSQNELSAAKSQERDYIIDYLTNYVESNAEYHRHADPDYQWHLFPDSETRVLKQVIEYISKEEFTLDELYYIFDNHGYYGYKEYDTLEEAKLESIDFIRDAAKYDKEDFARLKEKVETINPIVFGMILRLIIASNMFWQSEDEESISIDIPKDLSK